MMSALLLASARFSKLWILCLNDLLDADLCKKFFYFHIFPFSGCPTWFWSDVLILPISQYQTQQVMTSQIRPHIKQLIHTYYIFLCSFCSRNWWKSGLNGGFQFDLIIIRDCGLLLWATLYTMYATWISATHWPMGHITKEHRVRGSWPPFPAFTTPKVRNR